MQNFQIIKDPSKYFKMFNRTFKEHFSPPAPAQTFILERKVSEEIINDLNIPKMPGFRIKWQYNTNDVWKNDKSIAHAAFKR